MNTSQLRKTDVGRGLLQALLQVKSPVVLHGEFIYILKMSPREIDVAKLADALVEKGIFPVEYADLKLIAESSEQGIYRIPAEPVKVDAIPMNVQITEDQTAAFIIPTSEDIGEDPIPFLQVLDAVRKAGVKSGILYDMVDMVALCPERIKAGPVKIARWIDPIHGQDAEITYHFPMEASYTPLLLEDGSVDFHHVDVVRCVAKGQVLVTKRPASPGVAGKTVTGSLILPIKGNDIRLPAGKCTEISADGTALLAGAAGHVFVKGDKVHVEEVLIIQENVDFSTGDIDFSGDVIVKGDVISDFKVVSKENIHINKHVERAVVTTEKGSIFVHRGIHGGEKALLRAGEDIQVGFAEQAILKAGRSVIGKDALIHCNIEAAESVQVVTGKGIVLGGIIQAGHSLACKILGADSGGNTKVFIGAVLDDRKKKLIAKVREKQQPIEEEMSKVEKTIAMMKEVGVDTKDAAVLLAQHRKAWQEIENEAKEVYDLKSDDGVTIQKKILPGVTVIMAGRTLVIQEQHGPSKIQLVDGKLEILPLKDRSVAPHVLVKRS